MKKSYIFLILILGLNLLVRLPALFDPVSYGDECIYLTLGNALRKGLVFYRDIHDNKPPLLYFLAAFAGGKLFWFRLLLLIGNTVNVWLIYRLGKFLVAGNNEEKAGLLAALLFALFSFFPEGRIANGEIFMIIPASLGYLLILLALNFKKKLQKKKETFFILAGLCFSAAFLIKVPVGFDFIGLSLAIFAFDKKTIKEIKLLLLSFSLPIIASIIYYSLFGAFVPYVRSALLQNIGYLSSWGSSSFGIVWRALILMIGTGLLFFWRRKLGFYFYSLANLTIFGYFGLFLSGRPYPHYLLEVAPWLALLLTLVIFQKKLSYFITAGALIILLALGFKVYNFWWYPQIPYYQNFVKFSLGKISLQEYYLFFGKKTLEDYQVAKDLVLYSKPQDRVFIWGDGACIYALSGRIPPGRYTVNYHIYDFNGYQETLTAIRAKTPELIVLLEPLNEKMADLKNILSSDYFFFQQIGNALIYKRLPLL